MGHIDLHLHSTCSDGMLTPSELVKASIAAGLTTIALSDHDTVSGVAEAQQCASEHRLQVIPAVELSVAFQGFEDVHLLGYWIDINNHLLLQQLEGFAIRRANRNREIVMSVNKLLGTQGRTPLEVSEVEALAGGVIGRPHIARALMAHNYVTDMEQAFKKFLVPCNVPKYYWPMQDALATIRQAGGVAVLAHPTSISQDQSTLANLINELKTLGLDGIEVYNSMASEHETIFLQGLANRLGLLTTGGSDFHGISQEDQIGKGRGGIRFPDTMLPPLSSCAAERQKESKH